MDDTALYVTSAREIGWGLLLVAVSLGMHATGMITVLRFNSAFKQRFAARPSFVHGLTGLILSSWMILAVHLCEVMMWTQFFTWKKCFPNWSLALYFSLNEYTTVGSPLDLPSNWRLLEGMIATAGLLGFAWSTGVLLTLASAFQDSEMKRITARHAKKPPTSGE